MAGCTYEKGHLTFLFKRSTDYHCALPASSPTETKTKTENEVSWLFFGLHPPVPTRPHHNVAEISADWLVLTQPAPHAQKRQGEVGGTKYMQRQAAGEKPSVELVDFCDGSFENCLRVLRLGVAGSSGRVTGSPPPPPLPTVCPK